MQPIGILLAVFGVGALVIHWSLAIRIPDELVVTQPVGKLYRQLRLAVIRNSLSWTLGILVLPIFVYELVQLTPYLLQETRFLTIHDWANFGPVLTSWLIITLLLASIMQALALRCRHRIFLWHLGAYSLAVVFIMLLWLTANWDDRWYGINFSLMAYNLLMLIAAICLLNVTKRVPASFSEQISS